MNQNRNQNRRRGRGSNRGGQGGGGQGNRIDSRARGNAPQMLEKYRKLAHDSSLNGDRVQTEYYLQFADHYFRVVADSRPQQGDQRPRRDNEHSFDEADDYEEQDEAGRDRRPQEPRQRERNDEPRSNEGERGFEDGAPEAGDLDQNPLTPEPRGPRPRSRGRAKPAGDAVATGEQDSSFDPGLLPPSIAQADEAQPRRARGRRPRPAEDDGEETLEAVR